MPKFKEALQEEEYYVPQLEQSDSDVSDVEESPLERPKNKRSVRSDK